MKLTYLFLLILATTPAFAKRSLQTHNVDPEKELLIIDPKVVDSKYAIYPGPWSFGRLMEKLEGTKNNEKLAAFVENWLGTWEKEQVVNKLKVPARPGIRELIIDPWQKKDGFNGAEGEKWDIDMANAPFRLLAIVNRMDLGAGDPLSLLEKKKGDKAEATRSTPSAYSGGGGGTGDQLFAGEGRLVFGATDPYGKPLKGGFTVIFEYKITAPDPKGIVTWAMDWHELGGLRFNDTYLEKLSKITEKITSSTLGQIRTNEGALGSPREMREFGLVGKQLTPRPLLQTPTAEYLTPGSKANRALAKWINDNEEKILKEEHVVPRLIQIGRNRSIPMLAGSALIVRNSPNFHWNPKGVHDREARRLFSLNTCTGCHAGETNCRTFFHIAPREKGKPAKLSEFLRMDRGMFIRDPASRKRSTKSNEMERRAALFASLLNPEIKSKQLRRILRERAVRAH